MVSEDRPDRLTELKSRLKSFSPAKEALTAQERLVQIQEDLVLVASWGNSPEVKQIDAKLRDLYKQFAEKDTYPKNNQFSSDGNRSISSFQSKTANGTWHSFWIILKAIVLSTLAFLTIFIILFFVRPDVVPEYLIFLSVAIASWLGLFVFFKIAAPGVKLWFVKTSVEQKDPAAGKLLGIFGGIGFGSAFIFLIMGIAFLLPESLQGFLFFLGMISGTIIGVFIGISIAHQPLGR